MSDHTHNEDHHHEHEHEHTHDYEHEHIHVHVREHEHEHEHEHDHEHHHGGDHGELLKSGAEAAKFLQYTLAHNAHHAEELGDLAHSLDHLDLTGEAQEIRSCIEALGLVDKRLEAVLARLS